jgi:hypothetical protein
MVVEDLMRPIPSLIGKSVMVEGGYDFACSQIAKQAVIDAHGSDSYKGGIASFPDGDLIYGKEPRSGFLRMGVETAGADTS